jgi:hypothetical protein
MRGPEKTNLGPLPKNTNQQLNTTQLSTKKAVLKPLATSTQRTLVSDLGTRIVLRNWVMIILIL